MAREYKIIAVDFDGTLVENKYPRIGKPNLGLITYLIKRRRDGDKVILWTCRVGTYLRRAINVCRKYGLYFDAVNANLPEVIKSFGGDTRKIVADEYVDDRNVLFSSIPYEEDKCRSEEISKKIQEALRIDYAGCFTNDSFGNCDSNFIVFIKANAYCSSYTDYI